MDLEKRVRVLEIAYAGVLADAVRWLDNRGVLKEVTELKKKEQMASGKLQAERFGIQTPQGVFTVLSGIFNCASWEIAEGEDGFAAESKACKLCAIAKQMGTASPCLPYCLNPMEGMVKALRPTATFEVKETMWEGRSCRVEVR